MSNKWNKLNNPPPPLFLGNREKDLVKQVTDEITERVIGQEILYFPVDIQNSNFHLLYGECIEKTFLPPIRVYALINWEGSSTESTNGVIDRKNSLLVHFHRRRLTEDQNLEVTEGDFIKYGNRFYEIVELNDPRLVFGQVDTKLEVTAKCIRAREDLFNSE